MNASITTASAPRRARRIAALGLAAGLALALAGCGDDGETDASSETTDASSDASSDEGGSDYGGGGDTSTTASGGGGGGGEAVAYEVSAVEYSDVSAPASGTVEIENTSGLPHTFTADDGEFDVSYGPDESATVDVPADPGEYPFHCEIHSSMTATLTVE